MRSLNNLKVEISSNVGKIFKEMSGIGPQKIKLYIKEDLLIFRIKFYDMVLLENVKNESESLIESVREVLFKSIKAKLEVYLFQFFDSTIREIHFSYKAHCEEALIVVIFSSDIEGRINTN